MLLCKSLIKWRSRKCSSSAHLKSAHSHIRNLFCLFFGVANVVKYDAYKSEDDANK